MTIHPLKAYRHRRNLSQAEMAALIDTTKVTVSRIESGQRSPSGDLMKRIAEVTGGEVTPNALLGTDVPRETVEAAE